MVAGRLTRRRGGKKPSPSSMGKGSAALAGPEGRYKAIAAWGYKHGICNTSLASVWANKCRRIKRSTRARPAASLRGRGVLQHNSSLAMASTASPIHTLRY